MAGKPAACLTDMHTCPAATGPVPHVGGPIIGPGAPTVLIGGLPAARVGDLVTCVGPPDAIVMGAFNVLIAGQPAARMGDQTAHGGVIVLGNPTVLIGTDGASGGAPNAKPDIILAEAPRPPGPPATALTKDQVTWRLQHDTTAAARKVDAMGDDAFTGPQQDAIKEQPWLRPMYRGSAIDAEVRNMVDNDPMLNTRITGQPNKGVDFTDSITGQDYDMTTPGQVAPHLNQYGSNTIILNTNGDKPIMPEGEAVPPDILPATPGEPTFPMSEPPSIIPGEDPMLPDILL